MHADLIVLAAGPDWNTGVLKTIALFMQIAAVLIVLGAALKAVKDVTGGKPGQAAKLIAGTAVVVAFLWNPALINTVIDLFAQVVGQGVDTANNTVGTAK